MNIGREIQTLQHMGVAGLQKRWAEVYGEPARSRNRIFLWRRIAWRLQALAQGGLSERAKRRAEELACDADLRQRLPKGELAVPVACEGGDGVLRRYPDPSDAWDSRLPRPGAVLTREFRGRRLAVRVLEQGFEYEGKVYPSLSAVAKIVTGTHWNGFAFFGIDNPRVSR